MSFFKSKSSKDKRDKKDKKIGSTTVSQSQERSPEKTKSTTSDDDIENIPVKDIYIDPVIAKLKSAKVFKISYIRLAT